jgi:hypothetical protein
VAKGPSSGAFAFMQRSEVVPADGRFVFCSEGVGDIVRWTGSGKT